MKLSEQIIQTVSAMKELAPKHDLSNPQIMIANLVWLYQIMVASENLMEVAFMESKNTTLTDYLAHHRGEERDHAKWLREDLATVGIDPEKADIIRSAVEVVGTQYYLIFHRSPNALLGYMAVLEGFPFPVPILEQLEAVHGKQLLRCLRYHAEHDQEHRVELFRTIDKVNDPIIYQNAVRTQYLLAQAFANL